MSKNYKACLDVKSNAIKHNGFIAIHLKTDRQDAGVSNYLEKYFPKNYIYKNMFVKSLYW